MNWKTSAAKKEHRTHITDDSNSSAGAKAADRGIDRHENFSSSPPSFDPDDDSFFDGPQPSFSDKHSFIGEESFMTIDTSFVYRPSVLDDDEVEGQSKESGSSKNSVVIRPSLLDVTFNGQHLPRIRG
ncbi:unnamed protein product [Peronospora destructor]|uniref:Uncharacterized protein n=1 Tax=Peronospora destructor TaxID=86335 RepID=A0AAV0UYH4_9STRA|nr:unnamed protein product [Peronospora destructor]